MTTVSLGLLEEGSGDGKFTLIGEGASDPSARIRDFSLVAIVISALTSVLLLLSMLQIISPLSHFSVYQSTRESRVSCHDPPMRREWRALKDDERLDFISAIQCLIKRPSMLGLHSSRYDDFVYVHVNSYSKTHNVAPSLPWHRYYIKIFENALQEECKFNGQLPYWDWTLDAAAPEQASVWSATNGFGGNGDKNSSCVKDGPFADFKPQYPDEHCLQRNFIPGMVGYNYTAENISDLWHNTNSYHAFRTHLESGAHKSVHNGIGGDMPTDGSSNDPIFFVHHAQIDRVWWHWQQIRPRQRLEDYSGPLDISEPNALSQHALSQASLQDTLAMMGLDSDRAVADVMNTGFNILCYTY